MSKILVVEDDFGAKQGFKYLLEDYGHEVDLAENVRLALEKLAQSSYDLAIVDLILPDEAGEMVGDAGIQLLQRMEQLWPALPAVVVTTRLDPAALSACQQISNCKAYMTKDPNPTQFTEKVEQLLAGK
ncbi:MAG TPA: response regulator [Blastocatellia bacterium]|nr:response regulator [Blastocatellia bacterium]